MGLVTSSRDRHVTTWLGLGVSFRVRVSVRVRVRVRVSYLGVRVHLNRNFGRNPKYKIMGLVVLTICDTVILIQSICAVFHVQYNNEVLYVQ